jgi:hypothetical protein
MLLGLTICQQPVQGLLLACHCSDTVSFDLQLLGLLPTALLLWLRCKLLCS